MEIMYVYSKRRCHFGRQEHFNDKPSELHCDIVVDDSLKQAFIDRDPVDRPIQCVPALSEHECNTSMNDQATRGVNHCEGGWPRDINPFELEQVVRYRKKVERDDAYNNSMSQLTKTMEQCMKQNSAIDIYEIYFGSKRNNSNNNKTTTTKIDNNNINNDDDYAITSNYYYNNGVIFAKPEACLVNILRPPSGLPAKTATHISWYPESPCKLAVSMRGHANYEMSPFDPHHSYVWDINNCLRPEHTFQSPTCDITTLEYNPKDFHVVLAGLQNGQLALFDTRKDAKPFEVTQKNVGHREAVSQVVWVASKTGTEFFTGSPDGQIIWWDSRRMDESLDNLSLEPARSGVVEGALCLEYESTLPSKFMVGTDKGHIFLCNKKAKNAYEKIGSSFYSGHVSGVTSLQRSPFSLKNFLSIGDTTARIWVEDHKESSVWSIDYSDTELSGGCFSPTRPGIIFAITKAGCMDAWDLTSRHTSPVMSLKVSDSALSSIAVSRDMVACGVDDGGVVVYRLNEAASVADRYEKPVVLSMLEREAKREKMLEGKRKEIKNRERAKSAKEKPADKKTGMDGEKVDELADAEKVFWEVIANERKFSKVMKTF